MSKTKSFQPDWASIPGKTILDVLEEKKVSIKEFSNSMGFTKETATDLFNGSFEINKGIAVQLEKTIGGSAQFWINRQVQYQEDLAYSLERKEEKEGEAWLKKLPIRDMVKLGWLEVSSSLDKRLAQCLKFFDVPNVSAWNYRYGNIIEVAAFRTSPSFEPKLEAVSAWYRQGEIESQSISCKSWNPKLFRKKLIDIRALTRIKDPKVFVPQLKQICAECGVALVIVRTPNGCQASGATQFVTPERALMLLSFRYLSDDQFWFTFFHEAAHLLLHGKEAVFIEETRKNRTITKEEKEANDFAAKILIPSDLLSKLKNLKTTKYEIVRFARSAGVSPGIIIGQLQHFKLVPKDRLNAYKRRYNWENLVF